MLNQTLKTEIYGATTYYNGDSGKEYSTLLVGQQVTDEKEESAKGINIMKLSCEPDVYHALKSDKYPFPAELDVRIKKASGGKMGQHCYGLKKLDAIPARPKQ